MHTQIIIDSGLNLNKKFEVIERKGLGHPDTLSDDLGERLSIAYSKYCLENFGVILHHNFDKVGMMGGMSKVGFAEGKILSPIRVLINGRASKAFGSHKIPLEELLSNEVELFFKEKFPHIPNVKQIYRIIWEISTGSSPGAISSEDSYRQHWFSPRGREDLSELKHLNCNDTSMGVAYYGHTALEQFVLTVEGTLNSAEYKNGRPWLGNDIKLMCSRLDSHVSLILCVPQIGIYVNSLGEYKAHTDEIKTFIAETARKMLPEYTVDIHINMRDKFDNEAKDLYLTYTGSSIEMGDEGFVGRGNRFGGLIVPDRLYSMEGIAGKNPVYHTGKMYSAMAYELSLGLYERFNVSSESLLIGMTGHDLMCPHRIYVKTEKRADITEEAVNEIFKQVDPSSVTGKILNKDYKFY